MKKDLSNIIAIPSVMADALPGAPFGFEVKRALDYMLERGKEMGFEVVDKHAYGYIDFVGQSPELIASLCHLDVVPAGSGWDSDPYTLVERDGMLYGRGVVDNKGSAVAVLHAMKQLKDEGFLPRHTLRLILGCNEENGSLCLHEYAEKEQLPIASFVPDADFPLINSEKAILHLTATVPYNCEGVDIVAGDRPNVVPNTATLYIKKGSKLAEFIDKIDIFNLLKITNKNEFSLSKTADGYTLVAHGISAHAMQPHKGKNAAILLLTLLNALTAHDICTNSLARLSLGIANTDAVRLLDIAYEHPESGNTTLNFAAIKSGKNALNITIDIRLPRAEHLDDVVAKVGKALPEGSTVMVDYFSPNHYVPTDSPLVQTLLRVYAEMTGKPAVARHTGGGTYARTLPNAVAFGPQYEGEVNNIHNANECTPTANFLLLKDIYREAFVQLDKQDF